MNETQWKHRLQYARDHYPPGTRVRLLAMPDDPQPIPPGTTGTVMGVDDAGQLLMKWDNGRSLSLLPGTDSFALMSFFGLRTADHLKGIRSGQKAQ